MPIKVLLADDHGILRAGLRNLLNQDPDILVVGEAADGHRALQMAEQLEPDLILMDVSMPGMRMRVSSERPVARAPRDMWSNVRRNRS